MTDLNAHTYTSVYGVVNLIVSTHYLYREENDRTLKNSFLLA